MLDLEISPEEGLQHDSWEFLLGMHFSQTVAIVQSQVRVIKSAHVIYNDQNPLSHDLILDLPQDGFRLIFDSKSQRLKLIEIYNMKLIRLKYCGTVFNGSEIIPTVHQIDRCFGATRPGTFDKERQLFALNFRGLSFYFPVDSQFEPHYSHGLGSLRFPGESTPILSRILIYYGNNPTADAPVPPLPPSCFRGNVYCEECHVLRNPSATRTLGLRLKLFSHSTDALESEPSPVIFERQLRFGDSAQSVAAKLGTPTKVYYKSDDKMKIHSKEAHRKVTSDKSDYFFNYFTLGLDVLFDAACNRVIKFILHTNFPGHYDFTDYYRAPFSLNVGREEKPGGVGSSDMFEISASLSTLDCTSSSGDSPPETLSHMEKVTTTRGELESHITGQNQSSSNSSNQNQLPSSGGGNGGGGNGGGKSNKNKKRNNGNNNNNNNNKGGKMNQQNSEKKQQMPNPGLSEGQGQASCQGQGQGGTCSSDSSGTGPTTGTLLMSKMARRIDINWDSRWEDIRNFLCQDKMERVRLEKPVVLTRSSASNPFGPSLCYGVQDMIFEVMSNDHLASVSLYNNYDGGIQGDEGQGGEDLDFIAA